MNAQRLVFNGINGTTGDYLLPPMTEREVSQLAQGFGLDNAQRDELKARHFGTQPSFGVKEGVDPKDLAQSGWGVVFAHGADPAVKEALSELIAHRQERAGDRFRVYENEKAYRPGESKDDFLVRHGAGPGPADPDRVPYYLLLVGDPEAIPYRFQYQLDVQYAVGRLHFAELDDYARYARSVVEAERDSFSLPRRATFFGVRNEGDAATALSADELVQPLSNQIGERFGMGEAAWDVQTVLAADATKARLASTLGGAETPALLFTASHGMGFDLSDNRHPGHQGALLCQDWPGPSARGEIAQDCYFAADDVTADASLLGLIAFHFACFGAGTPRLDDFSHLAHGTRTEIAKQAFVAPLPQRLLSHPKGGALAVIGHVERAWACSFHWGQAGAQTEVFRSALHRLLEGHPIGSALEPFNARYAELSSDLSVALEDIKYGKRPDDTNLAGMWTANNDARSYAIIGDPAVRLRIGDVPTDAERPTIGEVRHSTSASVPPVPSTPTPIASPPLDPAGPSSGATAIVAFGITDWFRGDSPLKGALETLATTVESFANRIGAVLERSIADAASVTVKTYVADDLASVGDDFSGPAVLCAITRMSLDGDTDVYVPKELKDLRDEVWVMHAEMVERAQANRTELLKAAVGAATGLLGVVRGG